MNKKNSVAIYTSIFGGYDRLHEGEAIPGADLICFTDDPSLRSAIWDIRYVLSGCEMARTRNRFYKMLPHRAIPEYAASMYIDGNVHLHASPLKLFEEIGEKKLIAPPHPYRDCVYDEAAQCAAFKYITGQELEEWLALYREAGLPRHAGLFENNVLIRAHNDAGIVRLMDAWWESYCARPTRDQLSLTPIAARHGIKIYPMPDGPRRSHRYFHMVPHGTPRGMGPIAWMQQYCQINRDVNPGYALLSAILASVIRHGAQVKRGIRKTYAHVAKS